MKTGLPFPTACAIIGIAVAAYSAVHGSIFASSHGIMDSAMLIAFLVFLAWLISGSDKLVDGPAHDEPSQSFTFILGKTLKRAFRNRSARR
jgi:hypothetical protein